MTYKTNKLAVIAILPVLLVYVGYFFFAVIKYEVQPLGYSGDRGLRVFSGNKKVHLILKKVYAPMRLLLENRYHFLTEDEFEQMEDYARMFGVRDNSK